MNVNYPMIINGKKVTAKNHAPVFNPANGDLVGYSPMATTAELDRAVEAAERAFVTWSQTSEQTRRDACVAVGLKLRSHAEELAELITLEQGKTLNGLGSRFEMGAAQAWTHYTASLDTPMHILQDNPDGRIEQHFHPLGVVGSITPWNFPVMIAIWHILPAVRTGNTVVNKPSENTPLATIRAIQLMNEVLPAGVVSCVPGGAEIGAAMSAHTGIRKIVFTGSTATGRKIMGAGSETLKRMTLELGGNDAGIVLPNADPKDIAEDIFWGAFINNGQTCAALKRLYVHDDVYDQVTKKIARLAKDVETGEGLKEKNLLGPIQNRMQFDKVADLVADAEAKGRRVLAGGSDHKKNNGLFMHPTIIADCEDGDALVDEEQFGPALPIVRFDDLEKVIERSNQNPNGLGGSVWTESRKSAREVALRMNCGTVWMNKHGAIQPNVPFGGIGQSGIGREFGEDGMLEYLDSKSVFLEG